MAGPRSLLARPLVERGVAFVEVALGGVGGFGRDTHSNNFETVRDLSQVLDAAWATRMEDLKGRGLLEDTLIVRMGEFGRTPAINGNKGRDHFPAAWTAVLGGGGGKAMPSQHGPISPPFISLLCEAPPGRFFP
jgi:uncharacterized protein (DUF1501 family)